MNRLIILFVLLIGCSFAVAQDQPTPQPSPGVNLAKGKPCAFDPAPNYGLCTDPGDATDLTDSAYNGCQWREKGTVGWGVGRTQVFTVDLDLGREQPIGKITFDTVTGGAQVTFPSAVMAFASNDGKEYHYLGDVLTESLPQDKGLNHRFELNELKGWGRYVRLVILPGGFYVFCDEIEVMQGQHAAAEAAGADDKPVAADGVVEYALAKKPWVDQKNTTLALLRNATEAIEERYVLGATVTTRDMALQAVEQTRQRVLDAKTIEPADYWQGPPYRSFDSEVFAIIGSLNHSQWPDKRLRVWQDTGWTWLKPFAAPRGPAPDIRVDMMQNEWASASFNVTSCSQRAMGLSLRASEFAGPQKLPPDFMQIAQVIHTEAFGYNYRDDAIVPSPGFLSVNLGNGRVTRIAGAMSPNLAAGLSKRFWLTFKTRGLDIKPGTYTSTITISAGQPVVTVPIRLRVWPLRFPDEPVLHSNTWGYFNEKVIVGREPEAAQNLRDHYNTSLVINHSYLPYPKPDAQGNFTEPLDFTKLDQMIAWNPQCRLWLLWAGFEFGWDRLGTSQYGGPVWEKVFAQWVTQIRDHLAEQGIGRDKFAWYWIDEPGEKSWLERCLPTSKLLKRIDPQMLTWEDPVGGVTAQMLEEALPYFDMYCPPIGYADPARVAVCRKTKLPSWLYACASEKNADPTAYYRWLCWKAFKLGFGGIGMWVYVDANSVNASDYIGGVSYSLIYGSPAGILNSKRWEAWRQGIADYEYLRMLREGMETAKAAGTHGAAVAQAEKILTEGVDRIVGESPHGGDPTQPQAPDELRLQILECLETLGRP